MIDTCLTVVVVPIALVASIVVEVPGDAFPVTISTVDSVEVIATESAGSIAVVFPTPLSSTFSVLPSPGPKGDDGEPGENAQHVILTLAAYLALSPSTQLDGRWYIIPKTS